MSEKFSVRVPASSANLGPAFDSLAIALDLWNESLFSLEGSKLEIEIQGEGADHLAKNQKNLIYTSLKFGLKQAGTKAPQGLRILCDNHIPLNSGLGSSAAAVLTGLLAAKIIGKADWTEREILRMGAMIEGHADNIAAATLGGLVFVYSDQENFEAEQLPYEDMSCLVFLPDVEISTQEARAILDRKQSLDAVVANIGHSIGLIRAFEQGDIDGLSRHMVDQIHQDKRLALIPGAKEALKAAKDAGAAAAVSGAGPSLIAFVREGREKAITEAMRAPFAAREIATRRYLLSSSRKGAELVQ